tara:strand:+ start:799 stop:1509 length:711 start_codon:yes stop_codon:yes gene_type:complete
VINKKYIKPWDHLIVDDFLEDQDFKKVLWYAKEHQSKIEIAPNTCVKYNWFFDHEGTFIKLRIVDEMSRWPDWLPKDSPKWAIDFGEYMAKKYYKNILQFRQDLGYKDISKYNPMFTMTLSYFHKNFDYRRSHTDGAWKIFSSSLYVSEKNLGTTMTSDRYSEDYVTVPWKQNRLHCFVRDLEKTWHNFKADNESDRVTINFCLRPTEFWEWGESNPGGIKSVPGDNTLNKYFKRV